MIKAILGYGKTVVGRVLLLGGVAALVAAFGLWGVGPVIRSVGSDPAVASIGHVDIRASQLTRAYNRELARLRRLSNGEIDAEKARALGVVEQTLQSMITRAALDQQARAFAMAVPNSRVAREIRANAAFRNDEGEFDRRLFSIVLAQSGTDEDEYVASLRGDIVRGQLVDSLVSGLTAPAPLIEAIYRYREERRVADFVLIDSADIDDVPEPDEAAIRAYHHDHAKAFTAPEYRTLTYVAIRPADLADEIDIDEETLKTEYEDRLDEFTIPDQVDLDMMVFADQKAARRVHDRLLQGEDFLTVGVEETGQSKEDLALGLVTRDDLLPALAEKAFAMTAGDISAPIKTKLGWHLLRVNKSVPGHTQPLDEVRDRIRDDLVVERAVDAVFELGNRFEDELAGGASLDEAARQLGLEAKRIDRVDARGLGADGKPHEGLPPITTFLDVAFATDLDSESPLTETEGNVMFTVRVDRVLAPALRPLESVRDRVVKAWKDDYRRGRAAEIAKQIAAEAVGGAGLAAAAKKHDLTPVSGAAFTRDGRGLEFKITEKVVRAVFELAPGQVTKALDMGKGRFAVGELKEVIPAAAGGGDETASTTLRQEIRQRLQADVLAAFEVALRRRYGLSINDQLLAKLF